MKPLQAHPDYEPTMKKIDDQFWESHEETRKMLEQEGLLGTNLNLRMER